MSNTSEKIATTVATGKSVRGEARATQTIDGGGYWYGRNDESFSSIDLLNLLREYREAEKQMRTRTQESMRMGETDLVALRFLVRERAAGRTPRQRDLAQALRLTAASTSVLVDRLSKDGYIRRIPHPDDRRSVALEVLGETDREVKATLSGMHARMITETEALTEDERTGAAKFLRGLISSVSGP
jgi:DNA-binding MarR family transcriptional regulator